MLETKFLALMLAAALNPLVVRTPEPHGNVPADCEVSGRPAVPRMQVADVEDAAPLPSVRPASSGKFDATELDRALANNDRAAFDAALARARETGGPTRKYEDIARLWDAQFASPFFAQDSEAYRIASSYPGYEEAMRRHVFTDASGRKFYPAAESRAFVAGRALPTRPPAASTTRRASASPAPSRATTTTPRRAPSRPRVAGTRTQSRKPAATRESAPPSSSPDPSAPPKPAATDPAPAAPPSSTAVVDTSSTEAPPVAGSLSPETTTTSATSTTTTETTETAPAPITATATQAPATPASKGRPILLPAILILIGLGVLILLFRTKA